MKLFATFSARLNYSQISSYILNHLATYEELSQANFDDIVIATGVTPRHLEIEGANHPKALSYLEVLKERLPVGKRVAIIGAGGIGFDTAEYLTHEGKVPA